MSSSKSTSSRGLRLDAYLSRAGLASRKEARVLIRKSQVCVDGEVCRDAARRIHTEIVTLGEETVESPAAHADFVMHKPVGLACSHDQRESPLVFDLLDGALARRDLEIAGRLDRETSGLLILTTDGDLIHQLTHPTRKLPKRYRIQYKGELVADAVGQCQAGILLGNDPRPTRPAELELQGAGKATLVLREGRTHQVRRMIRALGGEVVGLHRDRVGSLMLPDDLLAGDLRLLDPGGRALLLSDKSL